MNTTKKTNKLYISKSIPPSPRVLLRVVLSLFFQYTKIFRPPLFFYRSRETPRATAIYKMFVFSHYCVSSPRPPPLSCCSSTILVRNDFAYNCFIRDNLNTSSIEFNRVNKKAVFCSFHALLIQNETLLSLLTVYLNDVKKNTFEYISEKL